MGIFSTAQEMAYFSDNQCAKLLGYVDNLACSAIPNVGNGGWELVCGDQDNCKAVAFFHNQPCGTSSTILQLNCPCDDSGPDLATNGTCINASEHPDAAYWQGVYVFIFGQRSLIVYGLTNYIICTTVASEDFNRRRQRSWQLTSPLTQFGRSRWLKLYLYVNTEDVLQSAYNWSSDPSKLHCRTNPNKFSKLA